MSNYLADNSYLALKPQVATTTAILPTNFVPLISESLKLNPNLVADRRLKGLSWKSDDLLRGSREVSGEFSVYADPDTLGHLLNMIYLKGSTSGSGADGYTHPFTVGEGDSYSIEVSRGVFATRIWGARGESLKLDFQDQKMMAVVSVKALGIFTTASLAGTLTGSVTTLVLSQENDLRPSDGLVVGDVLRVTLTNLDTVDLTLTSVNADGKTVGFASTAVEAIAGGAIFLLAQTPSYSGLQDPFYLGGALVGVGVDDTASDTAAASEATATPVYNLSLNFKNNLLDAPTTGRMGFGALLNQVREGSIELSRLFTDPSQYMKWVENVKQAVTIIVSGRHIKTDFTTKELLTVKCFNVKLLNNEQPLTVGQYVFDKQTLEMMYDSGDAKAITIDLVNRTAAASY